MSEKDQETNPINEESQRLISNFTDEFLKNVSKGSTTEVLLKGHLYIEYLLNNVMLLFYDKSINLKKKSFYNKIDELKNKDCFGEHQVAIRCLKALNDVRNELAHRLDFNVTSSQIDSIGFNLGKEYILRKHSKDIDEKELLSWVIHRVAMMVFYPIWNAMLEDHEQKAKPTTSEKSMKK